jgi:hypothetical protein
MRKTILLCGLLLVGTCCSASRGAVFERDWMTSGDGLLTYDNVHRREWLDLSVSRIDQFPEPRLENALAELAPGGLFEGFTWAKTRAVRQLAISGGIDISTTDVAINAVPTNAMIDLLSPTLESSFGRRQTVGFINEPETTYTSYPPYDAAAFTRQGGFAGVFFNASDDTLRSPSNGLMLYRPVPEPTTIFPMLFSLVLLLTVRL